MAEPRSVMEQNDGNYDRSTNKSLYQGMMDFGFAVGLPVGGAIALFVALLLIGAGIFTSIGLSFLGWLGLLAISKSFFVH